MKREKILFEGRKFNKHEIQEIYRMGYVIFIQVKNKLDIALFYGSIKDEELAEDYLNFTLGRPNRWMQ